MQVVYQLQTGQQSNLHFCPVEPDKKSIQMKLLLKALFHVISETSKQYLTFTSLRDISQVIFDALLK